MAPVALAAAALLVAAAAPAGAAAPGFTVARVIDGDTIELRNGPKVRLVQIDTPELYSGEWYGREASAAANRLLPVGTRVYLTVEPATDAVDDYGRLLRYVIRASDGVNVNLRLVAEGAATPYFYRGRRGRYAARLEALAASARGHQLGLWKGCPRTRLDSLRGVQARR